MCIAKSGRVTWTGLVGGVIAVCMIAVVLVGCSETATKPGESPPPRSDLLTGAGATFPSILYNTWFEAYHAENPNTFIKYSAVGSGEGIRRFIGKNVAESERVDFGASDAAMQDAELAQVDDNALMVPVTGGCVALAYNLPGLWEPLKLSRRAYTGIFQGEVKKWNDPLIAQTNPGGKLPDLTITTVVRQDASGTTYALTRHLDAISERWRSQYGTATLFNWPGNAMRASGNEGVAGMIQKSVGSIGYLGFEFARRIGLPIASIENRQGKYVSPSVGSCSAALSSAELPENLRVFVPDPSGTGSYPIATFSWILLRKNYQNAETARAIRNLFRWCLQDGQKAAPALNYVPLPQSVVEKALTAVDSVTPGG